MELVTSHHHDAAPPQLHFEEEGDLTRLFAAAQVVLVWHPRHLGPLTMTQSPAEHCWCHWRGRWHAAILAAAASVLLLGQDLLEQVQNTYLSTAPSLLKSCFIWCYAWDFPVAT
jgi:hypothetical protein